MKIHEQQTGPFVAGEVYTELRKLELDLPEETEIGIYTFSTCRADGLAFVNYEKDVVIAVSEHSSSDNIRILVSNKDVWKGDEVILTRQSFHSNSGPINEEMWNNAIFLNHDEFERAAHLVADFLTGKKKVGDKE